MADASNLGLGTILDKNSPNVRRDAVHVAVNPITATQRLRRGQRIKVVNRVETVPSKADEDYTGIVDPYLDKPVVNEGETFYLWLRPGSITSLVHSWTHKDLDADLSVELPKELTEVEKSTRWIEEYAGTLGFHADLLLNFADNYLKYGNYINTGEMQLYLDDEFWDHYEVVTGNKVEKNKRYSFFTCSC